MILALTADQIGAIFAGITLLYVTYRNGKASDANHTTTQVIATANHAETLDELTKLRAEVTAFSQQIGPMVQTVSGLVGALQKPSPAPTPSPSNGSPT